MSGDLFDVSFLCAFIYCRDLFDQIVDDVKPDVVTFAQLVKVRLFTGCLAVVFDCKLNANHLGEVPVVDEWVAVRLVGQ